MPGIFVLSYLELRKQNILKENIRRRCLRDASDPMTVQESTFVALYRINKDAFSMVLNEVAPFLKKSSIPEKLQLIAALRYLAVGAFQGVIANDMNISLGRSTMSKILWDVVDVLEHKIYPKWIVLALNEEEINASKNHFFEKYGMPNVIGCVDGTHIRIIKPSSDASLYYNRKGYYSLNAMIICDYKMKIRAIDACRPGSCHDAFIWRMSDARKYFRNKQQNNTQNGWLLGDSGYGLECFLMTPYRNPQFGSVEHIFNKKHCSSRNIVERTIGNLKSRFRCIQITSLHYTPPKVVKIVNVCCALHNICKAFNIEEDLLDLDTIDNGTYDEEVNDTDETEEVGNNVKAATLRNNVANSFT